MEDNRGFVVCFGFFLSFPLGSNQWGDTGDELYHKQVVFLQTTMH